MKKTSVNSADVNHYSVTLQVYNVVAALPNCFTRCYINHIRSAPCNLPAAFEPN